MNKTSSVVLVVLIAVVLIGAVLWYNYSNNNGGYQAPEQPANSSSSAPIVGPGAHCGGKMLNAPTCESGYQCVPSPGSNLPFGDVGGVCVSIQGGSGVQGSGGY
jgi:hypothetical protein